MLNYNEIIRKKIIVLDGEPYEVLDSHVFRKQQRKPVNQTKLRNLITGRVKGQSFGSSEKAEEAEVEKAEYKYIYNNRGEYWFHSPENPADRFPVPEKNIPSAFKFIKAGDVVITRLFDGEIINFELPVKVTLEVKESPRAEKGNTAQGATKEVVLETGAKIQTPLFVKTGDIIEINTEKEEYSGRAEKK